jgi:hypothetical protein
MDNGVAFPTAIVGRYPQRWRKVSVRSARTAMMEKADRRPLR